jgi:hypothetical protein
LDEKKIKASKEKHFNLTSLVWILQLVHGDEALAATNFMLNFVVSFLRFLSSLVSAAVGAL